MASKKNEALATAEQTANSPATALARASAAELALDPLAGVLLEGDIVTDTGTEELANDARIPRWAFNLTTLTGDDGKPVEVRKTVFVQTVSGKVVPKLRLQVISDHKSRQWKEQREGKGVVLCSSWDNVTGRMPETNVERPCLGCPDFAWSKNEKGENKRRCGEVHNVFALDLDTLDVAILSVKKTAIRSWKDYYSKYFHKQRGVRGPDGTLRKVDLPFFARETIVELELKTRGAESWAVPVFRAGPVLERAQVLDGHTLARDCRETLFAAAAKSDAVEERAADGGAGDSTFDFGENREGDANAASGMR